VNEKARQAGAKKVVELKVGGPFHSPLISSAAEKLATALEKISLQPPVFPVLSNVTARPQNNPAEIRKNLADQVASSVRWTESMRFILENEQPDLFIELGPGKTLRGLLRSIDKKAKCINIADMATLENAKEKFTN